MSSPTESVGTLEAAMANAKRLLEAKPALAAEQAIEILKSVPDHPPALLLLGAARRRSGDAAAALAILDPLAQGQGKWVAAHFERALALAGVGRGDEAIHALRRTVELKPEHAEAWRVLADHLVATGDTEGGNAAYARHIKSATHNPELQQAALAMVRNDIPKAERLLKSYLRKTPTDVAAIRMLAEVATRVGRNDDARKLLERCLELAPGFMPARYHYALVLHRSNDPAEALVQVLRLLKTDPRNPSYRNLHAVVLSYVGEYERALEIYEQLVREYPAHGKAWLSYGHVLKTAGRLVDGVDAYRQSIDCDPAFGEAYWSLANLKTFRFTEADLAAMRAQLSRQELDDASRVNFHFALGKACEDGTDYAQAFENYSKGNALYRASHRYDADRNSARAKRLKEILTRDFFKEREEWGCQAPDPIFIVSMPRAGSTLLEQILSSHSAVEGTSELPAVLTLAKELREEADAEETIAYAQVLARKSAEELRLLGEQYIERTRIQRKTGRPFFIDKMPNNFLHVGMIHAVLPNAKIIDARRHPLACCFSNFKQLYARGQLFSYDLVDMGRFYRDYVELLAHFDEALPGRVHRVIYEQMVEDTETEVRRLLDYCGLPFEAGCLRFFENDRPVRTASSEQVRQPIYRAGIDQWQHFDEWLAPLKTALGPVLAAYPAVPKF